MNHSIHISLIFSALIWLSALPIAAQDAFIQNDGQWTEEAAFRFPLTNGDFWLEQRGWSLNQWHPDEMETAVHALHGEEGSTVVHGHTVKAQWIDANVPSTITRKGAKPYYHNYFIGNDSNRWKSKVMLFDTLVYHQVWDGIDVLVTHEGSRPKLTYCVQAHADPAQVRIQYAGQRGMYTDGASLTLATTAGDLIETDLLVFQVIHGERRLVDAQMRVRGDVLRFDLGDHDPAYPLFIDPTVIASTNSGCTSESFGHTATFNLAGQIYSAGRGFGTGYPTDTGAFQADFAGPFTGNYYLQVDMCLSKYNQDASTLIYATYLGGNAEDLPHSMIATDDDHIVLLGSTNSTDYPVSSDAYDTGHNGGKDIVVTSLTADGTALIGSTYLGGSAADGVNNITAYYADDYRGEVVLDDSGDVYIASFSRSSNFPATNGAFQDTLAGLQDGVVCKLSPTLDTLYWSTYLGGASGDAAYALKVDDIHTVYVGGVTQSTNFPMAGSGANTTYLGGTTDGFMARLNADGTQLLSSSYFGTNAADRNFFVELGADGGVYYYGTSAGGITATAGRYAGPSTGGYIYRTNDALSTIDWVTSFGDLAPAAFLVDNCNRIYISGQGATNVVLNVSDFDTAETVNGLAQAGFYLMKLSPDAESLEFGTFYGNNGSHVDGGTSRFDKRGVVYQATCSSGTFPTTSWAYSTTNQATAGGQYDNTVFKIDFESNVAVAAIVPGDSACAPFQAIFDNSGSVGAIHYWDFGDGDTSTAAAPTHMYDTPGVYQIVYVIIDSSMCYEYDSAFVDLTVIEAIKPVILTGDTHCVPFVALEVDTSAHQFTGIQWNTGDTTVGIDAWSSGTYIVETTSELFCVHRDTVDLVFSPSFYFELNDTTICSATYLLQGPAALEHLWSTGDTTSFLAVDSGGIYYLTASDGACSWTDSAVVQYFEVHFPERELTTCHDSVILQASFPPNASGSGITTWNTGSTGSQLLVQSPGTYWVTYGNDVCTASDTITVQFDKDLVQLGPDRFICGTLQLNVFDTALSSFAWSNGDTTSSLLITESGLYWVKVSNGECEDIDSVRVEVEQLGFSDTALVACDADSFALVAPTAAGSTVLWSTGDTSQVTTVYSPGSYWVRIQTDHCTHLDTVSLAFRATSAFDLGDDRVLCIGETLNIPLAYHGATVIWSTGDSGSSIAVRDSGLIWAVVNENGCPAADTLRVGIHDMDALEFAFMANVITPNGDGLNDVFQLERVNERLVREYELYIYDRWGKLVFETNCPGCPWDGTLPSGEDALDGTYFYMMKARTECAQRSHVEIHDNVTLLRH